MAGRRGAGSPWSAPAFPATAAVWRPRCWWSRVAASTSRSGCGPAGRSPRTRCPRTHIYFTSSADGGRTWSAPVGIRPGAGRIGLFVTWIDVALSIDAAGNLYATWETQSPGGDIGWLSYSTDHGRTWSAARRVTPDHDKAEHIMAVT